MRLCLLALLLGSVLAEDWLVALFMEDCWECGSDSTEVYVTVFGKGGKKLTFPRLKQAGWTTNNFKNGERQDFIFKNLPRVWNPECIEIDVKSGNDAWKFKKIVIHSSSMKKNEWPAFANRAGQWMSGDDSEGNNHLRVCADQCQEDLPITNEKWELVKTIFHKGSAELQVYAPERAGIQEVDARKNSVDQSSSFLAEVEVTTSESFEKTTGASISVGTSFSVGVPGISEGEVNMEVSLSQDFSWGEEKSTTKKIGATYNCIAKAGKKSTCKAWLYMGKMDIKYTQIWKSKENKKSWCRVQTSGIFSEVAAVRMNMVAEDE